MRRNPRGGNGAAIFEMACLLMLIISAACVATMVIDKDSLLVAWKVIESIPSSALVTGAVVVVILMLIGVLAWAFQGRG